MRYLIGCLTVLLALAAECRATLIVVVVTTDEIVAGADSLLRRTTPRQDFHACKIVQLDANLFFAGAHFLLNSRGYNVYEIARRPRPAGLAFSETAHLIAERIREPLKLALLTGDPNNLSVPNELHVETVPLQSVLFGRDQGQLKTALIQFRARVSQDGAISISSHVTTCPGDCSGNQPHSVFIGDPAARSAAELLRSQLHHQLWVHGAVAGVQTLMETGMKANEDAIAKPFSILKVTGESTIWVDSGMCDTPP